MEINDHYRSNFYREIIGFFSPRLDLTLLNVLIDLCDHLYTKEIMPWDFIVPYCAVAFQIQATKISKNAWDMRKSKQIQWAKRLNIVYYD